MFLGVIAVTSSYAHVARAQIVVGGNKRPAVSVDTSVLDSLGAAPTLPQLFLDGRSPEHATRPVTATSRTQRSQRAGTRRAAVAQASSTTLNHVIHLIPPRSQIATAAPAAPAPARPEAPAASAPTLSAVAGLAAPVPATPPMPSLPQSSAAPAPPVLPPEPAHAVVPSAPAAPPPSAQAAAAPAAAAPAASPPVATPATTTSSPPAATPTVAATPAPAAAPPVQMAAATTVGSSLEAIKFAAGATDLPPGPQPTLDAVAMRLLANDNLRVQVIAHATGTADEAMEARRISLARAVAVRAYLIDKGVRSLRIDVRALGNRADEGPVADQVDLSIVSQ